MRAPPIVKGWMLGAVVWPLELRPSIETLQLEVATGREDASVLKTHYAGDLSLEDVEKVVTLAGWVNRIRHQGGIIFLELRDRRGIVQTVFDRGASEVAHEVAMRARPEYVLHITGEVRRRPAGSWK